MVRTVRPALPDGLGTFDDRRAWTWTGCAGYAQRLGGGLRRDRLPDVRGRVAAIHYARRGGTCMD